MGLLPRTISAVVLAGGKSRRMGQDKRFLELHGQSLLQRVLAALEPLFAEILLVAAGPAPELTGFGHRVVHDLIPDCATLGGVYTGLAASQAAGVFVVASDMPLLNAAVIRYVVAASDTADVVMPSLATGLQPTHAVYRKACLTPLEQMARARHLRIQDMIENPDLVVRLLTEAELRTMDPQLLSFFNANTPADLEFARTLLSGGPVGPAGDQGV